ncbi:hypothetical protein D5R55_27785 [Burkholderia cenocepacia]|uniref:Uncharacterized protein n=1 Tax=Burkholderia cenocepacia TaxID=95486 RepID=A0A3Q9FCS4_9BURK|nr:hypothetical protein D5R55_27785 [Burkholderia cenocepacia]
MRACNHRVRDDPTKFCAYRYRMRREANDVRDRREWPLHRSTCRHASHRVDSIGVSFLSPRSTGSHARTTGHRDDRALRSFPAVDSKNHYMNRA